MKKFISILLIAVLLLSLAACQSQPQPQTQPEIDHVAEAQKLLDAGKTKEAYEYLYTHRDDEKAAEMLSDFLVVNEHIDVKDYDRYNATRVIRYNEHGDLVYEEITYPFDSNSGTYDYGFVREYVITYDSEGRKQKSTEILDGEEQDTETYTYDSQGLLQTFQNSYMTETYTYDSNGNVLVQASRYTDSSYTEKKEFTYDGDGNLLREISSYTGGGEEGDQEGTYYDTAYTYDSNGDLIRRVDNMEDGRIIDVTYTYNDRGDVTLETKKRTYANNDEEYVDETSYQYTYDDGGNVTKKVTESPYLSKTEEFVYNEQGDVIRKTTTVAPGMISSKGYTAVQEFEYVYGDGGDAVQITEVQNQYTEYTAEQSFDHMGNMTSQQANYAEESVGSTYEFTYDGQGRVTKKIHTTSDGETYTYEYEYDDRNNVTKKIRTHSAGYTTTYEYTYDDQNREIKSTSGNTVTEKEYDQYGNVSKRTETDSDGKKTVYEYISTYDEKGNVLKEEYHSNGTLQVTTVFEYDGAGKLTKWTRFSTENEPLATVTYEYDEDGNLLREKSEVGEKGSRINAYELIYRYDEYGNMVYELSSFSDYTTESVYSDFAYFYLPGRVEIP